MTEANRRALSLNHTYVKVSKVVGEAVLREDALTAGGMIIWSDVLLEDVESGGSKMFVQAVQSIHPKGPLSLTPTSIKR